MPSGAFPLEPNPKRQKVNLGSALRKPAEKAPDYEKGIQYWDGIEASVDGVLGGFGNGPVPHIDQLTSRLLLLSLLPILHTFPSPLTPCPPSPSAVPFRRTALDVGAGIGRVTRHTLLPLFDDVVLLEPVEKFITEATRAAGAGEWRDLPLSVNTGGTGKTRGKKSDEVIGKEEKAEKAEMDRRRKELREGRGKRVWMVQGGLQGFDPAYPLRKEGSRGRGVFGERSEGADDFGEEEVEVVYDVIWCQWCLGHMSHQDLLAFFKRAQAALRPPTPLIDLSSANDGEDAMDTASSSAAKMSESYIFVKENCCPDDAWGKGTEFLDPADSSLTRSSARWIDIFKEAGLKIVKEEVQEGLPEELFTVKTWALQ